MPFIQDEKYGDTWNKNTPCRHKEHNPPLVWYLSQRGHIVLPPGTHIYQCPECGEITTIHIAERWC